MSELSRADQVALDTVNARLVTSLQRAVTGDRSDLATARDCFRQALLTWKTASCLPSGPLVFNHALLRALFWPIRPSAVESFALGSSRVDERAVSELGVDQKGLFALEFLLFGSTGTGENRAPLTAGPGTQGTRARALCLAFAENIAACAKDSTTAGADGNVTLSLLLSHMSTTLGAISSGRLSKALMPSENARPAEVQGAASGTSYAILEALIRGVERIYLGEAQAGLTTLVAPAAPDCDRRLRGLFRAARETLHALGATPAPTKSLLAAREVVHSLDVTVETELASALGVTLAFAGTDAD